MPIVRLQNVHFNMSVVVIAVVAIFSVWLLVRASIAANETEYGSDLPQQQTGEVPDLADELKKVNPLPG